MSGDELDLDMHTRYSCLCARIKLAASSRSFRLIAATVGTKLSCKISIRALCTYAVQYVIVLLPCILKKTSFPLNDLFRVKRIPRISSCRRLESALPTITARKKKQTVNYFIFVDSCGVEHIIESVISIDKRKYL